MTPISRNHNALVCRAAAAALKAGQAPVAIELYSEILKSQKHTAGVLFNRSLAYIQNADHELAIKDLEQAGPSLPVRIITF